MFDGLVSRSFHVSDVTNGHFPARYFPAGYVLRPFGRRGTFPLLVVQFVAAYQSLFHETYMRITAIVCQNAHSFFSC